ncbi:major facilitator superfamily domain-containing protein [Pestalotiopsis sp. NC0098]|nr:major facilitator superfamily domain-containing protein [Pestalotiopsis sp. NC0098]
MAASAVPSIRSQSSRDGEVEAHAPSPPDEKNMAGDVGYPAEESETPKDFPWTWKVTALACGIALSWGSSFSENTLGPLKSTLIRKLNITNSQYGAISSATALVNTILPIVGGYGLDYYGVEWGSLACSTAIFLGATISAAGSNHDSFTLVMTGRIIMGFGSTIIETCTSKILAHWFQHRGLGLVYGLDVSIGKIIVLAAKATAVPMRDATSFWGWALWIPAIVCFANLLQNIFYIWWAHTRPEWARIPTGRQLVTKSKQYNGTQDANNGPRSMSTTSRGMRRFTASSIWRAINNVPRFFWLMACTQILQAGVVSSFNGLNADIITTTRGSTAQIAGYTSSVQQVIPIICTPLIGFFFDTFGYRMMIISFTSAIWILVYCLIGFTQTNALGTMVIASLGSAFNAIPFLVSIPLVVTSQAELGLVFGIWKAFNNSGTVVVDMIAGRLQDITPGGTYERVITFFVAVKGLEFCLGMFYGVFDRRYLSGVLSMSEKKRMSAEANNELGEPLGRKPSKLFTVVGMSLLCAIIIVAWVLFIKYSI